MDKYDREVLETYQGLYDSLFRVLELLSDTGRFTEKEFSDVMDEALADTEYYEAKREMRKYLRAKR